MNHQRRVTLESDVKESLFLLSEGNPGAASALIALMKEAPSIDPADPLAMASSWLALDRLGLYGPHLYVFFADLCGRNVARAVAVLRACALGLVSEADVQEACHTRQPAEQARLVDVPALYQLVKAQVPLFDPYHKGRL